MDTYTYYFSMRLGKSGNTFNGTKSSFYIFAQISTEFSNANSMQMEVSNLVYLFIFNFMIHG